MSRPWPPNFHRCLSSAFTPDRSPNLGLVRVLERGIKEAKADLRPSDWE